MSYRCNKIGLRGGKIALILATLVSVVTAHAASVKLEFYDERQQPLSDVVAVLVPKSKPDYSTRPTATVDQRNNMFVPGVLAVRTNTLVHFPNSDNVRHHVYSFSPAKRFELRLYHGQTAEPVLFDQAGQVVLGCNIHDSMLGYIYVVDSEYYGVSDEQGRLTLTSIPAGDYELELQHPKLETPPAAVKLTLSADDVKNQSIVITGTNKAPETENADNDLKKLFKRND